MKLSKSGLSKSLAQLDYLLETNQYDKINVLFQDVHKHTTHMEHSDFWREFITVVQEICNACSILHDETEWYQYAAEETKRHEYDLKQALSVILHLAEWNDQQVIKPSPLKAANQESAVSLWQRFTSLFNPLPSIHQHDVPQTPSVPLNHDTLPDEPFEDVSDLAPEIHTSLDFHCLGRFSVYLNGQCLDIGANRRAKSVLKYLVLHHAQPVSKEVLMDCFWPDASPEAARNSLNVAVYNLRQALRKSGDDVSYILFQDNTYLLNPALDVWFDFEVFTEHCQKARQLDTEQNVLRAIQEYKTAESLYTGQLFEEDRYEDWPVSRRNYLQEIYLQVLERLSEYAFSEQAYAECINLCNNWLMIDPCCENAHMRIMQCHSRQGQHHLAVRQYQRCVDILKRELDLLPGKDIALLYQRIRMSASA
jgi:DNA-binding SARP family transcriptional activator